MVVVTICFKLIFVAGAFLRHPTVFRSHAHVSTHASATGRLDAVARLIFFIQLPDGLLTWIAAVSACLIAR